MPNDRNLMIFEQIATGGCQSYLLGCPETRQAAVIDPEVSQTDRYLALAAQDGLTIRFLIDSHTHADHFFGHASVGQASPRHPGNAPRRARTGRRHAGR